MPYVTEDFLKKMCEPMARELSPTDAFLLGKLDASGGYNLSKRERARCIELGWAEPSSYGGDKYLSKSGVSDGLAACFELVDPPEPEPEPEPMPEQPAAPTFTPDPEPVKLDAESIVALRPCTKCGAPKCAVGVPWCSDCQETKVP